MSEKQFIAMSRLAELTEYNPETGAIIWRDGCLRAGKQIGAIDSSGHGQVRFQGVSVALHRLAWFSFHGFIPADRDIDHINGIKTDNRLANLRVCTRGENCRNQKRHADAAAPYKGVTQAGARWMARIMLDGKSKYLGRFDTAEQAASAYDKAARELFGEFAHTNGGADDNAVA